jgi:hypothetical protein
MPNAPSLHLMEAEARTQRAPQAPRACSRPARLMAGRRFLTSKVAKLLPSAATVNTHTHRRSTPTALHVRQHAHVHIGGSVSPGVLISAHTSLIHGSMGDSTQKCTCSHTHKAYPTCTCTQALTHAHAHVLLQVNTRTCPDIQIQHINTEDAMFGTRTKNYSLM